HAVNFRLFGDSRKADTRDILNSKKLPLISVTPRRPSGLVADRRWRSPRAGYWRKTAPLPSWGIPVSVVRRSQPASMAALIRIPLDLPNAFDLAAARHQALP